MPRPRAATAPPTAGARPDTHDLDFPRLNDADVLSDAGTDVLSDADYALLLGFRTRLRRFEAWSRAQAAEVGLTGPQHQLLLAVRGHGDERGPSIGQLADYLLVRPHSVVELVDRAEQLGLVQRRRPDDDQRVVRVTLTARGRAMVAALSSVHLTELRRLAPVLGALVPEPPERRGPRDVRP